MTLAFTQEDFFVSFKNNRQSCLIFDSAAVHLSSSNSFSVRIVRADSRALKTFLFYLQIGCDRSFNLCDICAKRGFPVFVCDALQVPLRAEAVDACISIAVIHHMSTLVIYFLTFQTLSHLLFLDGVFSCCDIMAFDKRICFFKFNRIFKEFI